MPSSSIHVVANGKVSFSLMAEYIPLYICTYHIFLIRSSISRHLDCFCILPIVNSIAVNWSTFISELLFSFSSDKYPEVELLDHMIVLFLVFWETFILFSIAAVPVYIPANIVQGFHFIHILTNQYLIIIFCVFLVIIIAEVKWYIIVALIFISLIVKDVRHFFLVPIAQLCVFFGKISVQILCQFLNQIISYWVVWVLNIWGRVLTSADIWLANIFSHFVGWLFILLMVSFAVQKLFSLMFTHLFIFSSTTFVFMSD